MTTTFDIMPFFFIVWGERAPPRLPLSAIFDFYYVIKSLFLACFPAQL